MSKTELLDCVRSTIERNHLLSPGDGLVVGVSGGPDSLCLLHLLLRLRDEYGLRLHVAHLNHRLRGAEAEADAAFVTRLAAEWGLAYTAESRDVALLAKERKLALEEAARQARYGFLGRVARAIGAQKVAVGHNADDQVETICMHWLRGSGLAGLRGMQALSRFEELRLGGEELAPPDKENGLLLIRPLLEVPRAEVEAYCAAHHLQPRFDRSNLDTTYYRNRLRHELLPFLETFNPGIRRVLLRSANILAADYAFLREQATGAWAEVTLREEKEALTFDLARWRALPLSLQRSLLREAIHCLRRSLRNINWVHIENAVQVLQTGNTGMVATLPRGLEATLGYDQFTVARKSYVTALPDMPCVSTEVALHMPGRTSLPDSSWSITAKVVDRHKLPPTAPRHAQPWQAYLDYAVSGSQLAVRPRHSGDRFWPQGLGDKPTTLNSFMTNAKIPRAWRDAIPVLVSPEQVLWLAGWRVDERAKVTEGTTQVLVLSFVKGKGSAGSSAREDVEAARSGPASPPEEKGG
jgi:tRNA(Ile)-lysidine synthase